MFHNLFHPTEDTYISQFYANTNFGTVPYLYTNRYQGSGDEYQSLLKFNWGFVNNSFCHPVFRFRSRLLLKIYRNEVPSSVTLLVHRVLGSWSELNVTWNNRPAIDPTPIGSAVIHPGFFGWVDISLSHFADDLLNHGILLKCNEAFDSLLGFYSSEFTNSSFWPQLIVAAAEEDEVEKPVIKIMPTTSVTLSPDLIRVPSILDDIRSKRFDDDCDDFRSKRFDDDCDDIRKKRFDRAFIRDFKRIRDRFDCC